MARQLKALRKKHKLGEFAKKRKFAREFESMTEKAEMKTLSKISLERTLTNEEYKRYMQLGKKYLRR